MCLCPVSYSNDITELVCSCTVWLHSHTKSASGIINGVTIVCWCGELMWGKCYFWMRLHVCGKQNILMCVPHTLTCTTCIDQCVLAVLFQLDKSAADTLPVFVRLCFCWVVRLFAESFSMLNARAGLRDWVFPCSLGRDRALATSLY